METIITKEVEKSVKETAIIYNDCSKVVVTNNEEYQTATSHLKIIKEKSKEIEDRRVSMTKPINESLRSINAFFKEPQELLKKAEGVIKAAALKFQQEQELIRRKEEARLAEQARKEEEKKRNQLAAQAEKAKAKGREDKAQDLQIMADTYTVPQQVVETKYEEVKGISTKKTMKAVIKDISKIPQNYYINDERILKAIQSIMNKFAVATGGNVPVSGVKFEEEEVMSVRH